MCTVGQEQAPKVALSLRFRFGSAVPKRQGRPREEEMTKFKKEKEQGLHGWFSRNDGKGWVDCKTGKPCGRQEGEKRAYPACRPTKSQCTSAKNKKTGSKSISWGKKNGKKG